LQKDVHPTVYKQLVDEVDTLEKSSLLDASHQGSLASVSTACFIPGLHLSLMDIVALTDTTWSISKHKQRASYFSASFCLKKLSSFS